MTSNQENPKDVKRDFGNLMNSLGSFFSDLVDLQEGIDREGTLYWIKNNKRMRGANAWLLMCSIVIASLGLDMNSPAIIIGAMLISPLMSPILGVGMGIGTNDKESLLISLQHFGVSIAIALITSYIYFWINPLGQINPTREIIDRTEPTVLAGAVAIFGGIAGIISASRKDQSNAIPGVAIATALMPPLCVAGYGLANQNWNIFSNAFYLFFLNSFFIAISTFVFIRYMKFPVRVYQNEKESRRTSIYIIIVSILLILPSILILKKVVDKKRQDHVISTFISSNFGLQSEVQSLGHYFVESDSINVLTIQLHGPNLKEGEIAKYEKQLSKLGVTNTKILPIQDRETDIEQLELLQKDYKTIVSRIENSNNAMSEADIKIQNLEYRIDSIKQSAFPIAELNRTVTPFVQQIDYLDYGQVMHADQDSISKRSVLFVHWKEKTKPSAKREATKELKDFLAKNYSSWNIELRE